jgi:hypothetical protein
LKEDGRQVERLVGRELIFKFFVSGERKHSRGLTSSKFAWLNGFFEAEGDMMQGLP